MSDLPITFSAPMVLALLAGRKTQTRRILRQQPPEWCADDRAGFSCLTPQRHVEFRGHYPGDAEVEAGYGSKFIRVPHWQGDRLYVREHWRTMALHDKLSPKKLGERYASSIYGRAEACPVVRIADAHRSGRWAGADDESAVDAWKPGKHRQAMHMPRWGSRLTLAVTSVKVERVQEISDDDAWAEGVCSAVEADDIANGKPAWGGIPNHYRRLIVEQTFGGPAKAFNWLWDGLHRKPGHRWEDNPLVVATTFRVLRGNIDSLPQERAA